MHMPQRLLNASVASFFRKRSYYTTRKKFKVSIKMANIYTNKNGAKSTVVSRLSSSAGFDGGGWGGTHSTNKSFDALVNGSHFGLYGDQSGSPTVESRDDVVGVRVVGEKMGVQEMGGGGRGVQGMVAYPQILQHEQLLQKEQLLQQHPLQGIGRVLQQPSVMQFATNQPLQVCCSVLQCATVCCNLCLCSCRCHLQCVAMSCSM